MDNIKQPIGSVIRDKTDFARILKNGHMTVEHRLNRSLFYDNHKTLVRI